MSFTSFNFWLAFPIIFLLYWLIPAKWETIKKLMLIIVSYLLYMSWKPSFALVLLAVTLITYCGGRLLENKEDTVVKRKRLGWLFAILGLLPLLFFKYYNFINENVADGLSALGLNLSLPGLNWAVPVGISFFTFQAVGYMLDVYHKRINAERDFIDYTLFVSIFPSIVSGPINKASLMLPQIKSLQSHFDYNKGVAGLKMILWGMFMKVVVADRVGMYVDTVLPNYMNYTGITCFVASLLYTIQIYADFAGYSLMAIGVGKTLGFNLAENFRRPYFSVSVTDFWRRWHISLSTWLKDYVYIPLGGSRCSKIKNYWNIFVTFLVSGIWHGANWTFIVWGCIHGISQIVEKALGFQKYNGHNSWTKASRILLTFLIVNFAWIFFRMPTLSDACGVVARIFDSSLPMTIFYDSMTTLCFIIMGITLLLIKDISDEFYQTQTHRILKYRVIRWIGYIVIIFLILTTGVLGSDQFIYANF